MKKTKFSKILAISFPILVLVASSVIILYSFAGLEEILTARIHSHLETTARAKADQVEIFLQGKKDRAVDFSSDGFIKNSLYKIKNDIDIEETTEALTRHLIINKLPVDKYFLEVFVLDTKGIIVSSTNDNTPIGFDFSNDMLYLKGKSEPFVKDLFFDEYLKKKILILAAPVLREGKFVGVVAMKMLPDALSDITTERTGLGETGESYIVNRESFLITPSRFLRGGDKGILVQIVNTENSVKCLIDLEDYVSKGKPHGYENDPIIFNDYRGEKVIGAHHIIPEMNWCLLAEIDKAETWGGEKARIIMSYLIILFIIAFFAAPFGFFIGRYMDNQKL